MNDILPIRASSLAGLFRCAYRWEAMHLLGMRQPASQAMVLGSAVHAGAAAYDIGRMTGAALSPNDAAEAVVAKLRDPGEEVKRDEEDMPAQKAETIALTLHSRYCTDLSPRYEFRAVELDLGALDVEVPEERVTVRLTGHMDRSRVVRGSKRLRIADLKTGARAATKEGVASTKGHGLQLGIYQLLAENVLGEEVDEVGDIIGLATNASCSVGTAEIAAPKAQVLGHAGGRSLIEMAAAMLRSGIFPPNPSDILCSERYCVRWSTCSYHE